MSPMSPMSPMSLMSPMDTFQGFPLLPLRPFLSFIRQWTIHYNFPSVSLRFAQIFRFHLGTVDFCSCRRSPRRIHAPPFRRLLSPPTQSPSTPTHAWTRPHSRTSLVPVFRYLRSHRLRRRTPTSAPCLKDSLAHRTCSLLAQPRLFL